MTALLYGHCHPTAVERVPGICAGLRVDPDVIENPHDLRALGNEGDQVHLATALRAQQREHL